MENKRNYYHILHVQPDAPDAVIRASYRAMMQKLKLHPDLGGNEQIAAILNDAYTTLSNVKKRALYDNELQASSCYISNKYQSTGKLTEKNRQSILGITHSEQQCLFCGTDIPANPHPHGASDCMVCNSPLKLSTSHLQAVGSSGRNLERQLQNAPLKYYTRAGNQAQFGILRDLSPLGLRFQLSEPLENGQVLKLVCDALTAVVKVKNCRKNLADGLYIVGVEFLTSHFNQRRGTFFSEAVC